MQTLISSKENYSKVLRQHPRRPLLLRAQALNNNARDENREEKELQWCYGVDGAGKDSPVITSGAMASSRSTIEAAEGNVKQLVTRVKSKMKK